MSCKDCIFFNKRYKDYKVIYTKTEPKVPIIILKEKKVLPQEKKND